MKKITLLVFSFFMSIVVFFGSVTSISAFNPFQSITPFVEQLKNTAVRFYLHTPGSKSGQMVFSQSNIAMSKVNSFTLVSTVSAQVFDDSQNKIGSGEVSIMGPMESINTSFFESLPKQDFRVIATAIFEGMSLETDAEVKIDGADMYFKVNTVPVFPLFDLRSIRGDWVHVDLVKQLNKAEFEQLSLLTQDLPKNLSDQTKQQLNQQWQQLLTSSTVGLATKQTRNSNEVFVIPVSVSKNDVILYVEGVLQTYEVQGVDRVAVENALSVFFKKQDNLTLEVMVDAQNYYVRQVTIPVFVSFDGIGDQALTAQIELIFELSEFNEPHQFVIPEEAKDFDSMMNQVVFSSIEPVKPVELEELSPYQIRMLHQYGLELKEVIE